MNKQETITDLLDIREDLIQEIERQQKKLKQQLDNLQGSIKIAQEHFEGYRTLNDLGVVQGMGPQIDNQVGRIDGLKEGLKMVNRYLQVIEPKGTQ
jgi:hypothetical protein